ncbi:MAG TPA: energy transducer TonB [Polyangia bacterium]|nr:energy transducer TonB [Polyangia bacterium]
MIVDRRIVACAALSVAAHVALARGLAHLPPRQEAPARRLVSVRVIAPPPAPEPPPEPAAAAPPAPAAPKAAPRPHARPIPRDTPPPVQDLPPPPENAPPPGDSTGGPVFGISMESTSPTGGPALPVGSPSRPTETPNGQHGVNKGAGQPVPEYEATTMPLPQGRCFGKYTEEAKQAGVEGTVVLDIVVGANGRASDVRVVSGLRDGLTEAAVAAVNACRFSPGEKNGVVVPVRIRAFKIRFVLGAD